MKISVVIVDFHKADSVVSSITQILNEDDGRNIEFVILDNSCSVSNWEILVAGLSSYRNVKLLNYHVNYGYAKGYNIAVEEASGEYLVIQNPDIEVESSASYQCLVARYQSPPSIGIVGVKQINPDGSVPSVVRSFPSLISQFAKRSAILLKFPYFRSKVLVYECDDFDYSREAYVPWLQSSFYFMSKETWRRLGGFDERFFVFMADVDMCMRAWLNGLSVIYCPSVTVKADGKRSSEGGIIEVFINRIMRIHVRDAIAYYLKYLNSNKKRLPKDLFFKNVRGASL